jgi:hypothetical protein
MEENKLKARCTIPFRGGDEVSIVPSCLSSTCQHSDSVSSLFGLSDSKHYVYALLYRKLVS